MTGAVPAAAVNEVLTIFIELHYLRSKVGGLDVDVDSSLQVTARKFARRPHVNNHGVSADVDGLGRGTAGQAEGGTCDEGNSGEEFFHGRPFLRSGTV